MRKYFCLGAIGCSPGLFFKVVLKCGWEFAHRFFERITHFCERKSNSLVKKSESLPSLLCHSRGEENCSWALFKISNFEKKSNAQKSEFPTLS